MRLARAAREFTARRSRTCRKRVDRGDVPVPPQRNARMVAGGKITALAMAPAADTAASLERAELMALIQRQQATIRDQKRALSDQRRSLDAAVAETLRAAEEVASDTLTAAAEEDARLAAAARRELAALRAQRRRTLEQMRAEAEERRLRGSATTARRPII